MLLAAKMRVSAGRRNGSYGAMERYRGITPGARHAGTRDFNGKGRFFD
jgi:hypothetical protein